MRPGRPSTPLEMLIDFGPQPLTNRFLQKPDENEETHPLGLAVDPISGLVQLPAPAPYDAVRARFDWIKYNEAEDHLDDLVERIARLPNVRSQSRIVALSYKDDSMIDRFRRRGFDRCARLDLRTDLGIDSTNAGLETIQHALSPRWAHEYVARNGHADVVLARHIWEHSHRPAEFIAAVKTIAAPDAYIVIEVPDCSTLLDSCDYSMPWEEHVLYFTPMTFARTLAAHGLSAVEHLVYPYPLENSLVCVAQNREPDSAAAALTPAGLETELTRARRYGASFESQQRAIQSFVGESARRGPIAVLGAGHSACMFIQLHRLGHQLACVLDDAPVKQGLFMPGSRLPIKPSSELLAGKIALCILSVNHNAEDRVIARNNSFLQASGEFLSLYRTSPRRLPL